MRTLALTAVLILALTAARPAAGAWRRPLPGPVTRGFAYGEGPFRAGWHRGADLAAAPGARVRAACSGLVVTARAGASGVVTLRCGPWRVTHLPLGAVTVLRGERVAAGEPIGTLAPSHAHAGLHLGVRRAGDRFAYVDPLPFLGTGHPPTTLAPAPRPRLGPRPRVAPPHMRVPRPPVRVRVSPPLGGGSLAPWPAWLGLACLLLGAAGGGVRIGVRRRRVARAMAAPVGVP